MKNLAKQIAEGIKSGESSVKKLGVDHATAQRIYRQMKTDGYDGSLVFYVCEKLCDETLGNIRELLALMGMDKDELPETGKLISLYKFDNDKDVLFCAMIGATIKLKPTNPVDRKCLDIIYTLYTTEIESLPHSAYYNSPLAYQKHKTD